MKILKIDNLTLHIADTEYEYRKALKNRKDYVRGWHPHHIAGRYGILKLMIENIIFINPALHVDEKCGELNRRRLFKESIKHNVDNTLYKTLIAIRDHYKYLDATGRKYIEALEE